MSFLEKLGSSLLSSLNSEFGIAENVVSGLDTPSQFGTGVTSFGALGAFANNIDKSAERRYLETGTIRGIRPRASEIIMQQPDLTVVIKKRLFSSLAENFRYDLMNTDDKLFIRATKRLFYNKCRAIASYERLSKIERIAQAGGAINDFALPQIFTAVDSLDALGVNLIDNKTRSILETVRKVKYLSDPNFVTTWTIDKEIPYVSDVGEGTGTFELTLVQQASWTNSVKLGGGSASLTVEDPYKLMVITNDDIERAILEASGRFSQNNFFRLAETQLEDSIEQLKNTLNQMRTSRGAARIVFRVNADSLQFKKVRAIIDEEGREIIFSFDGGALGFGSSVSLDESAYQGINGISRNKNPGLGPFSGSTEEQVFNQIISNIFQLLGMRQSTMVDTQSFNKDTNYVRRKMRLHYGSKNMIQPMDVVNIFVSSKTATDDRLVRGLTSIFSGATILNKINDTVGNIESAIDDIKNTFAGGSAIDSSIEIEKAAIVGSEFPTWLWSMMRNDFTRQAAGTCVFVGIVEGANHSYGDGRYTLNVSVKDNSAYLKMGQININPSSAVFNSALYDPVTPFKLDFDASSGFVRGEFPPLLDENIRLLNSGSVKFKNGRFRGAPVTENMYKTSDAEPTPTVFRKKLNDPDGFVYRWKEGIGSLLWSGEPHSSSLNLGSFASETSVNINKDPFAGQDVMNVLSLLITGQPYNFNTFMKAAVDSGQLSRDDLMNEDGSSSFYRGLISDITKQNQTWGNFIPFKKLVLNDKAYEFLRSGQLDLTTANSRITELLTERAKRFDQLTTLLPQFANDPSFYKVGFNGNIIVDPAIAQQIDVNSLANLGEDIIKLDTQIDAEKRSFANRFQGSNISDDALKIFGDDISFDSTVTDQNNPVTENQQIVNREEFRKRINTLTQRRLWKVKGNEDPNLFIVDDTYDKNFDIQAFEKSLAGKPEVFNSTFTNVAERVELAANMLGLEVFADSQGHIQIRPPQYNRMPSSIFYKMVQEKGTKGIQIFPDYLESLFFNQVQGLTDQLEILEDQIRIRAAVLGYTTDDAARGLLNGSVNIGGTQFSFISEPSDGKVGQKDLRSLLVQAVPDFSTGGTSGLKELSASLKGQLNTKVNFDILRRTDVVNTSFAFRGNDLDINDKINLIGARLRDRTGAPQPTRQSLLSNDRTLRGSGKSQLDVLKMTNELAQLVSERQQVIKLLANSVKNLDQGITLNQDKDPANNFLYPFLNRKKSNVFPEILEHMIEDEDVDDYGFGSGNRYLLTDSKIISLSVTENPPDWTIVQVNGQLENNLVSLPGQTDLGNGGNGVATAYAVDYDMWRMYGFRNTHSFPVSFLSDPKAQLAPYAVFLLNKARKEIFQASCTVVGNEFIQAGEVYYIEDRDLLFYAETISGNFNYNSQFTTTLSLKYGHNPGEYIPTMLDVIGKGLYTRQHQANLVRHVRYGNASGDTHLNVLLHDVKAGGFVSDTSTVSDNPLADLVSNVYGDANRKNLGNILLATNGLLTPTTFGQKINIELRTYFNSAKNISEDGNLKKTAEAVKEWILNPSKTKLSGPNSGTTLFGDPPELVPDNNTKNPSIDEEAIQIIPLDLSKIDDTRSPSGQAWNMSRSLALNGNPLVINTNINLNSTDQLSPDKLAQQELAMLCSKVIDVWVTFTDPDPTTVATTDTLNPAPSQAELDKQNKAIEDFKNRLKVQ